MRVAIVALVLELVGLLYLGGAIVEHWYAALELTHRTMLHHPELVLAVPMRRP